MSIITPMVRPMVRPMVTAIGKGGQRTPAQIIQSLFAQGQQGFWLPFTDFASLSQDSAGTLPYTALEQPVGLILDKSKGGRLSFEVVADPEMTTLSGLPNNGNLSSPFEIVPWQGASTALHVVGAKYSGTIIPGTSANTLYYVEARIWVVSGSVYFGSPTVTVGGAVVTASSGWQEVKGYVSTSSAGLPILSNVAGSEWYLDRVSIRQVLGNHAMQPTSTARGVVSARVNITLGFASAGNGWISQAQGSGSGGVIAANTLDTDGGYITSIQLRLNGGSTTDDISQVRVVGTTIGLSYVGKFQIRTTDGSSKVVGYGDSYANINTISITGEWADVTIGPNNALSTAALLFFLRGGYGHSDSANIDVRRVSSVLASQSSLPYQRVNTSTDYDSIDFPKYLRLDGTDDNYTCGGGGSTTGFYYSDVIRPMGGGSRTLFYNSVFSLKSGVIISLVSNKFYVAIGNGSAYVPLLSAETLTNGELVHVAAWDDLTNVYLQINGGTIQSMARPAMPAGPPTINLYNTGAVESYSGQVTEPIYRAGPPPSAYERSVIRGYQMQKAGL